MNNGGFHFGDVTGDVTMQAGGDIVAGNKTVIQNIIQQAAQKIVTAPYKFLASYDISDRDIFFGRTGVIEELAGKIPRHKTLILNGRSGSGKTSLINAGLIPRLAENGYFYVSFREYTDPLQQLRVCLSKHFRFKQKSDGSIPLSKYLQAISRKRKGRIVIIFDQFERFFVNVSSDLRTAFISEIKGYTQSNLNAQEVNVLFSLREDFFGTFVIEFENVMPQFLNESAHFNLHPLSSAEAREAIMYPLKDVPNIGYNIQFVDEVLLPGLIGEGGGADQIAPPHLQIVCNQLYETACERYAADLEKGGIIRIDHQLYEELGATKGILRDYLDNFIDRIARRNPGERDVLRSLLKLMIQTTGTRKFVSASDLKKGLPDVPPENIERYVRQLQDGRVVETRGQGEASRYSLSHEFMVEKVQSWFDEREMQRRKAQETLERGVAEWKNTEALLNEKQVGAIRKWLGSESLGDAAEHLLTKSQQAYEEHKRREAEQARRLKMGKRLLWSVIALALIVAGALTGWALYNAREATTQAKIAQQEQKTARSRELAAFATAALETDATLSFRLAEAALQVKSTQAARSILFRSLLYPFHNILQGHVNSVRSVAFSPDGTRVVSASDDKTARIWDAITGKELHRLGEHPDYVLKATFSPDGKRLITLCNYDKTVRIWDAATGKQLLQLSGHTEAVSSAAFSPDSTQIVTASYDKTARIWDVASGQELRVLTGHTDGVNKAEFSPDGTRIVTVSWDNSARLWDASTGKELHRLTKDIALENTVFSPDGGQILLIPTCSSGEGELTAWVWDTATGKEVLVLTHTDWIDNAAFSPDGRWIVTTSWFSDTAHIYDAATGKRLHVLPGTGTIFSPDGTRILTGGRLWEVATGKEFYPLSNGVAAFSPDGSRIVIGSYDNTVRIWNLNIAGAPVQDLTGHETSAENIMFSPDGKSFAAVYEDDGITRVWKIATGETFRLDGFSGGFSADSSRIVTIVGGLENETRIWDVATGQELHRLTGHIQFNRLQRNRFSPDDNKIVTFNEHTVWVWDAITGKELHSLSGHTDRIDSAVFSLDGTRLVTTSGEIVQIWDVATGKLLHQLKEPDQYISETVLSPDGSWLVTIFKNVAQIWDVTTGEKLQQLTGFSYRPSVNFSPDGNRLITESERISRVWETATAKELFQIDGSLWFSPDGTLIANSALEDNIVRILDAATGEVRHILSGHTNSVEKVMFSPDGTRLLTASWDKTLRIWDTAAGKELFQILPDRTVPFVTDAMFSPDGTRIAIVTNTVIPSDVIGGETTIRIWPSTCEEILRLINEEQVRGVVRHLTEEEKKRYGFIN